MTAHIAGAPVEELLSLLTGVSGAALLVRTRISSRLRTRSVSRATDRPDRGRRPQEPVE